jgi:hypothetical protein
MNTQPIMEETEEDEGFAQNRFIEDESINDEIDSLIKQYAGNTVDTAGLLKQKEVLNAQKRAKQRLKLNKKKEEIVKLKEAKKEKEEKIRRRKEIERKRKREIQSMHQKKRKQDPQAPPKSKELTSRNDKRVTKDHISTDGLGETEPDKASKSDMNIHAELDTFSPSNPVEKVEVSQKIDYKKPTNGGQSRYSLPVDDPEDYDDDFDIEGPNEGKPIFHL